MENVVAFNSELSGLYDAKPPISKAKMASITKSAMRAIKFYKHVVQSVEKFILKCKPEYKVPGLYVIDSIVRQSRHQYGPDKDVFAPRFARNISETFANLFRCAPEDKSRIVRVLNLWQKNNVFAPEVIQPIFDFADPSHPIYQMPTSSGMGGGGGTSGGISLSLADLSGTSNGLSSSALAGLDMSGPSGMMGASSNNEDKMGGLADLSSLSHKEARNMRQLEHLQHHYMKRQNICTSSTASGASCSKSRDMHGSCCDAGTSMKSHYYYYDDVDDNDEDIIETVGDGNGLGENSPPISSSLLDNNNLKQLLNDPNVLRQLQTLQNFQKFKQQEENQKHKLNEMRLQEEAFEKHLQNVLKGTAGVPPGMNDSDPMNKDVEFVSEQQNIEVINLDGNDSRSPTPDRERYKRRRSSRSRSRTPRDRGGRRGRGRSTRSRSRSRSPRSSNRRRSSRDRERDRMERNSNRDKERDREHERERRKRGLPDIKKEHLSVCSTTLWVGHLSKLVGPEELSDTFGEYGDIVSIDQIVPRGCAFIVMNRRQDAYKGMQALKNHKLQGRAITISWAAGKGVKSKEWKDFWDLELGVTFIPWNKLDEKTDLDSLEEGGMFDEDTMPHWMKDKLENKDKQGSEVVSAAAVAAAAAAAAAMQATSAPPPSLLFGIDTTQPPPNAPQNAGSSGPPPPPMMHGIGMPGQFSMAPPMSGPPHRMLGPMGPVNPMTGIPMPPNLVPGIPPPHPMMMPPGMMPPGFPAMSGPGPLPLGLPPGAQYPPPNSVPPAAALTPNAAANLSASSDDQMDIEMELEDAPQVPAQQQQPQQQPPNFNQPPPMFAAGGSAVSGINPTDGTGPQLGELFNRDRRGGSGGGGSTRWSARDDENMDASRWHENGPPGGGGVGGSFQARNPPGGPMNAMEMRPDFINDFDNRGPRGGPRNGDFFQPNMNQNRFNQPTSLMQMRIPPPAAFNQRMSGPSASGVNLGGPMFVRNQGNGGPGGRPQGQGFFNPRNPFNDNQRVRGGGGSRGPGGAMHRGGRTTSGNWSDEDDEGNNFKRRGGANGSGGGSRFRDRDSSANSEERGRGGNGSQSQQRSSRPSGNSNRSERESGRNRRGSSHDDNNTRNSISSTDEQQHGNGNSNHNDTYNKKSADNNREPTQNNKSSAADTEDDWDRELQEYDAKMAAKSNKIEIIENTILKTSTHVAEERKAPPSPQEHEGAFVKPSVEMSPTEQQPPSISPEQSNKKQQPSPACTPLYDELPPPTATATGTATTATETLPVIRRTPTPPIGKLGTPPPPAVDDKFEIELPAAATVVPFEQQHEPIAAESTEAPAPAEVDAASA